MFFSNRIGFFCVENIQQLLMHIHSRLLCRMDQLELVASIIALAGVYFTARTKVIGWPLGIVGAFMYLILCYQSMLYAESVLQGLYVVMGVYGWIKWSANKVTDYITITRMPIKAWIISLTVWIVFSLICGYLLDSFSQTDVPYADASLAVAGVVVTWQLAKKYLENWLNWIVIDLLSSCLFFYKQLYFASALYFILAALAVYGYLKWKKDLLAI